MGVKVGLVSLGCPKNLVDSETMLGLLKGAGFTITNQEQEADVLIVNTCSFINESKEESIGTILDLARYKDGGSCRAIVVAGCLAQRYPQELMDEMPEIDCLLGTGAVPEVVRAVQAALAGEKLCLAGAPGYLQETSLPRMQSTPPYTAYLKIAEGCDNRCSYCVIPSIRGPYRSRTIEDVEEEAQQLASGMVKEVVLVAQDTTRYGFDRYGKPALAALLKRLAAIDGLIWLRVLYTYPSLISDELVEIIASENKVCRYLDLPLQHASQSVLAQMNRRGSKEETLRFVEKLRSAIPGITLRTTFITGFPGETEADLMELMDFMKAVRFDRVGIFAYSQEENTPAAGMPGQIPEAVKLERREHLMALQQEISLERNKQKTGSVLPVLIEGIHLHKPGVFVGRSEGDAPVIDGKVFVRSELQLAPGDFVQVLVSGASEYDLTGELIK
ncbi:MAG: Ribosomal protein S12 methylthiotransferase RimO [Pelotomaculum sp. PtaB.Bin104]|nr:MAG: Ribosomal protein S12 methylthiotransferase RimO [Pelotomaculum sp. PtaB.Bin104]